MMSNGEKYSFSVLGAKSVLIAVSSLPPIMNAGEPVCAVDPFEVEAG
jgi:hypothetical protein